MPEMTITLEEPAWPDLGQQPERIVHITEPIGVSVLERGMTSGRASVMFRIDLPDGRVVLAETSLRLFLTAARAAAARFPEQVRD